MKKVFLLLFIFFLVLIVVGFIWISTLFFPALTAPFKEFANRNKIGGNTVAILASGSKVYILDRGWSVPISQNMDHTTYAYHKPTFWELDLTTDRIRPHVLSERGDSRCGELIEFADSILIRCGEFYLFDKVKSTIKELEKSIDFYNSTFTGSQPPGDTMLVQGGDKLSLLDKNLNLITSRDQKISDRFITSFIFNPKEIWAGMDGNFIARLNKKLEILDGPKQAPFRLPGLLDSSNPNIIYSESSIRKDRDIVKVDLRDFKVLGRGQKSSVRRVLNQSLDKLYFFIITDPYISISAGGKTTFQIGVMDKKTMKIITRAPVQNETIDGNHQVSTDFLEVSDKNVLLLYGVNDSKILVYDLDGNFDRELEIQKLPRF